MLLLGYLAFSGVFLFLAYRFVGAWLARAFGLRAEVPTPAQTMRDGVDYEPLPARSLIPQHLSAIAAAGPIVGPILAGMYFGWGPAWLWLLLGSVLIGGIHDFTALLASVRHRARSIAEVVREYMNPRAHVLFLLFIWFALIYVIVAFTDVTAGAFLKKSVAGAEDAPGPAVATSSTLYLLLAVAMGCLLRFTKVKPLAAKLVFIPLVFVAIWIGPRMPMDLTGLENGQRVWGYFLLGYCFVAALAPLWSLLQPRGELGGWFLYIVMGGSVLGIVVGAFTGGIPINQPFFSGWNAKDSFGDAAPLFPILFITVACGACSGFHSIVASGTTSKQLAKETDVRPVAYGSMLLEAFFSCIALATFMVVAGKGGTPDIVFAQGIADFLARVAGPLAPAGGDVRALILTFALLCFATFVFDTLDACTRLARYVLMELLGWRSRGQAVLATALSLAIPALALALPGMEFGGKPMPLWRVFWNIFGSSNQLLAALTLLGVTVWLARRHLPWRVTLFPAVFMMAMTLWSLGVGMVPYLRLLGSGAPVETLRHVQFGISLSLMVLALWLVAESLLVWRKLGGARSEPASPGDALPA